MMGVYIKGMKMPESCDKCLIGYPDDECVFTTLYCPITGEEITGYCLTHKRSKYCPASYVPEHGRLIDADILRDKCDDPYWCVWMSDIDDSPTIIPADREGE